MSPCSWIKMSDGTVAHLNMGRARRKRCKFCKSGRFVEFLCDGDVSNPKAENSDGACDKGGCAYCMRGMGKGQHLCPDCVTAGVKCVPAVDRCNEGIGGGGRTCYLPKGHDGVHIYECGR